MGELEQEQANPLVKTSQAFLTAKELTMAQKLKPNRANFCWYPPLFHLLSFIPDNYWAKNEAA